MYYGKHQFSIDKLKGKLKCVKYVVGWHVIKSYFACSLFVVQILLTKVAISSYWFPVNAFVNQRVLSLNKIYLLRVSLLLSAVSKRRCAFTFLIVCSERFVTRASMFTFKLDWLVHRNEQLRERWHFEDVRLPGVIEWKVICKSVSPEIQ